MTSRPTSNPTHCRSHPREAWILAWLPSDTTGSSLLIRLPLLSFWKTQGGEGGGGFAWHLLGSLVAPAQGCHGTSPKHFMVTLRKQAEAAGPQADRGLAPCPTPTVDIPWIYHSIHKLDVLRPGSSTPQPPAQRRTFRVRRLSDWHSGASLPRHHATKVTASPHKGLVHNAHVPPQLPLLQPVHQPQGQTLPGPRLCGPVPSPGGGTCPVATWLPEPGHLDGFHAQQQLFQKAI